MPDDASPQAGSLRLAEPLAALSLVADLTLGYPDETALRACGLAMRLARELGLREDEAQPIYWVTLLATSAAPRPRTSRPSCSAATTSS